jgi:zinc protease
MAAAAALAALAAQLPLAHLGAAALRAQAVASTSAASSAAADSAQARPPAPGPLRRYEFPRVQQFSLANGARVIVVERHTLPVVAARLIVDAGSMYEPSDKAGVAVLTGSLLDEGTRSLSGDELARRLERLGAQLATSTDYAQTWVDVTSLSTVFADAMALAATTVTEPSFAPAEFARIKSEALAAYEQKRARVEGIAPDVFFRAIFEQSAPYARPVEGTRASISALTRDDVVRWYQAAYGPATTTLLVVGDVTAGEARRVAERALGGWRATAKRAPAVRNPARHVGGTRVILVDRPGSVQSAIRVGQAGIAGSDPEYLPMTALNMVLGGGFNARINMNLRERHGFTYGAFSALDVRRDAGTFAIRSTVRTDATDSALVEAIAEYRRIATEAVPDTELAGAVNNLVASFPSSVQTVQGLEARLQTVLTLGLPLDYYATYRERLAATTSADVLRAARKHLAPDALTVVVVGDLSKVEQPIRARHLGTVEVWDAEGNRVR